jgi:hypothetical protein
VHNGLIASGDRSLRSATKRNEIAAHWDVLAIEMEGKGIGNTGFYEGAEWFTVRGISDYGDRHTTPAWRCYASMAAAAYVRALLAVTPAMAYTRPNPAEHSYSRAGRAMRLRSPAFCAGQCEPPGRPARAGTRPARYRHEENFLPAHCRFAYSLSGESHAAHKTKLREHGGSAGAGATW